MAKVSKKQRSALKEIDKLSRERTHNMIWGYGAIAVMAALIFAYNTLAYNLGALDAGDTLVRGALYVAAMVLAGVSGVNLMKASRKKSKIDGFRQSTGISRETLEDWRAGKLD